MTGKSDGMKAKVDGEKVNKATEIMRTYEIELKTGGIIFKMYKPSEMNRIMTSRSDTRRDKWKKSTLVGSIRRGKEQSNKPVIIKNRSDWGFFR